MRSNFEPGTTRWAVRRAQWKSLGLTNSDLTKPKIAVVNSSSALSSCYTHLDELSRTVQEAIRAAGGLPFEIRTVAPSDFITSAGRGARYLMPTRDLIVNDIEVVVEGALLDGMVCLSSCDKTTPAHLMAAARLDIPSILVIGGYQPWGTCDGRPTDIDDVYESVGAVAAGTMTIDRLGELADHAICGPGVCAGLGTANTMHIIAEALGMAMPDSAPVQAGSDRMNERATQAGRQIVTMIHNGLTARDIITEKSIRNAVTVTLAAGGSVNAVRHLTAIAAEAQLDLDVVGIFEQLTDSTPLVIAVRPNGPHRMDDLDRAGGSGAIMRSVHSLLATDAMTVTGRAIGDVIDTGPDRIQDVVKPMSAPVAPRGGLMILRGNIAPGGAIVKVAGIESRMSRTFTGRAVIFTNEDDAMAALRRGAIARGDVVVLRGMGPFGGPGTVFAAGFVAALVGAALVGKVAVITDGELSGLNSGIVVGQVSPEAALGGPLSVIHPGDSITVDLPGRRLDMAVPDEEIQRRLSTATPTVEPAPPGWLAMYRTLVQPIETTGAALRTTRPPDSVAGGVPGGARR